MKCTPLLAAASLMILTDTSHASPADASRVAKTYQEAMEKMTKDVRVATTVDARAKAWAARPDPVAYAKEMWSIIKSSLAEESTLDSAAWFLSLTASLRTTQPNGSSSPTFATEINAIRAAVESHHMKSPKLSPVCLALAASDDPRSLALLEKIQSSHADKAVQGVAALAIAMRLRMIGDDPNLMSKRLTLLRKAIIDSAHVEINGTAVAKLAEDELYVIRYLSKGRVAPDLTGNDSGMRPLKLSDHKGKVIVVLFWNSSVPDLERFLEMADSLQKKFAARPFIVIGVNNDSTENLRELQKQPDLVDFPNFSDPQNRLAYDYRVGTWPMAFVLDRDRKIHYAGQPGTFVDLTAAALLDEPAPAENKK